MNHKNLNVFKMCAYCPWRYPSNWWSNIKQFFRHFKWAWQRASRGYCDYDCFALDDYYLKLIPATLRELAKDTHGYPEEFGTIDKWQEEIIKIAEDFEAAAMNEEEYFQNENWFEEADKKGTLVKDFREYNDLDTLGKSEQMVMLIKPYS